MLGDNIRMYRKKKKITAKELGKQLNLAESTISGYENNTREPSIQILKEISQILTVSVSDLIEEQPVQNDYWELNKKDKRDIKKDLDNLLNNLDSDNALAFNGEPLDDETRELLAISLERSLRFAKEEAKKKYTPKKYRDKE